MEDNNKITRMFDLYNKLQNGEIIYKPYEAVRYGVSERSIQRDIENIRSYFDREMTEESGIENRVIYDRKKQGYRLERIYDMKLTNSEILAVCKILLDSRAFTKKRMDTILEKLITCCVPECNQKIVNDLISNEQLHYIEPQHKSELLDTLWMIGQAICEQRYIQIKYKKLKGKEAVSRKLKPAAIMFSEFYFYMAAFIEDADIQEKIEEKASVVTGVNDEQDADNHSNITHAESTKQSITDVNYKIMADMPREDLSHSEKEAPKKIARVIIFFADGTLEDYRPD